VIGGREKKDHQKEKIIEVKKLAKE